MSDLISAEQALEAALKYVAAESQNAAAACPAAASQLSARRSNRHTANNRTSTASNGSQTTESGQSDDNKQFESSAQSQPEMHNSDSNHSDVEAIFELINEHMANGEPMIQDLPNGSPLEIPSSDDSPSIIEIPDVDDDEEVEYVGQLEGEELHTAVREVRRNAPALEVIDLTSSFVEAPYSRRKRNIIQEDNVVVECAPPKFSRPVQQINCPVCMETASRPYSTLCGHIFCHDCITRSVKEHKKCPICNKRLTLKQIHQIFIDFASDSNESV